MNEKPMTLLEAVRSCVAHAARFKPGGVVPPATVLWTAVDGQCRPVVEQWRGMMPELLTLGAYDVATRTEPALGRRPVCGPAFPPAKFPELAWPRGTVPVIYMPGVSRQTVRAVEECPQRPQAAGRSSIPRDGLDTQERQGLDGPGVPKSGDDGWASSTVWQSLLEDQHVAFFQPGQRDD